MLYNDLCWYDVDDYLDKNPAEVKTPLFFQDFSKISGPWTDRGHPVERTYWHVERTYWHVERTYRHVDTVTNKNGWKMGNFPNIFGSEPRPNVSNSPKELNENEEWSMWTVGSIMLEIFTYGRLYGEDTNDYTGICARTYWQHSSNILAKYPIQASKSWYILVALKHVRYILWNHRVYANIHTAHS